jgi:ELWxxDGT repeat protein
MADNTTNNAPLVPVVVTTEKIMHNMSQLINVDGTVYFVGDAYDGKGGELYKLDANDKPVLVAEINKSSNSSIIGMITNVNGIVYFNADEGSKQGLYRIDPSTGAPVRLGDMIIFTANTQNGISANIVNLGDSDYFLANRGDEQLWKIDRSSGALSKVTPNGLPDKFSFNIDESSSGTGARTINNILSVGSNLYFRGNGQVWKFDPATNNTSSIQIPNQTNYFAGELHQLGDALFFRTNSGSSGQELYKIDATSGDVTLVSDPKFASSKYVIDENNFVDVNGILHFTTNYGHEIWKLDATGKAVLAGTINGAGITKEPSNFVNVNGTLCFAFDDGVNKTQIWKIQSDGTVASITTLAPNQTYGGTFVNNLTAIGDKLYFTADDAQYGRELRELDITTGSLTTLDLSPGLYASSPASSYLESHIIDINGTPYFTSLVHPDGASYVEDRIFKLAASVPEPPTPPTPPEPPVVSPFNITATDKSAAEIKIGETQNPGQFVLTRTGDLTASLEVTYLLSGTAVNGVDYEKVPGKVTFAAGEATAIVDIKPIDDNIYEGNETVFLTIVPNDRDANSGSSFKTASNLTNTAILNKLLGVTTGLSNITLSVTGDKEAYGTFDNAPFDIGSGIVLSTGKVTDLVGANISSDTTTDFGTTDPQGGFDPITLKIDFNTDSTASQVFFQYVFGSEEFTEYSGSEYNDIFTLTLNGTNLAKLSDGKTATINNLTPSADPKTWSSDYIDNPTKTGPLSSQVILDGYTKTLTFAGNLIPNSRNTLEIKIKDISDGILDSAVFLKGGSLGVVDPSTLANAITIEDNDLPPTVSISDVSFNEGKTGTNNNATFTLTLSNPSGLLTTVDYATADDTALAGIDYTKVDPTTVTFAPGETSKQIIVPIIGDLIDELDKTFKVNLSNPTNSTLGNQTTATGTILNDDTPISLAISDANAGETKTGETPNPGQFVITRAGDLNKTLTVKYKLSGAGTNGADYQTLTGTSIFAAGVDKAFVDVQPIDDKIYEGTENITLSLSTDDYLIEGANSVTAAISDNDSETPKLLEPVKNLLTIEGGSVNTLLKFTKVPQKNNDSSEICAFVVDDDLGSINGIKPGESGYLAAAIDRARTIFSSLGGSDFDRQWDNNSQRYLDVTQGERIEFLSIANDTLDRVKADLDAGKPTANVLFSLPEANPTNAAQVKFTSNSSNNNYEISFKDLVLKVEAIDNFNLQGGTGLQSKFEGQVIDLRAYSGRQAIVDTRTIGDAAYNNYIGFYEVEDESGTLANGLKPGDAGYAEAAIKSAVLTTRFKSQADTNLAVTGGKILAPVVVANGTFENFLKQNPSNNANSDIHAYFNYLGANTDKVDHFRLLGDNKFGVEDIYGGGDRDYNDLIFQMTVKN